MSKGPQGVHSPQEQPTMPTKASTFKTLESPENLSAQSLPTNLQQDPVFEARERLRPRQQGPHMTPVPWEDQGSMQTHLSFLINTGKSALGEERL